MNGFATIGADAGTLTLTKDLAWAATSRLPGGNMIMNGKIYDPPPSPGLLETEDDGNGTNSSMDLSLPFGNIAKYGADVVSKIVMDDVTKSFYNAASLAGISYPATPQPVAAHLPQLARRMVLPGSDQLWQHHGRLRFNLFKHDVRPKPPA